MTTPTRLPYSLPSLLKTEIWLTDRRRALEIVEARLENANTTYSNAASLGELRRVTTALKGIHALTQLLEDDIQTVLTRMEVEEDA
jgi:hypothetical protein